MTNITASVAWQTLDKLATQLDGQHMRDWFISDPDRVNRYNLSACGINLDYSKNRINQDVVKALLELANNCQVLSQRDAMFNGDEINSTEGRAVLHTALRNFSGDPKMVSGVDVMPEVKSTLKKIKNFTQNKNEKIDQNQIAYTILSNQSITPLWIQKNFFFF